MAASLPPSSKRQGVIWGAACSKIFCPTPVDPVKEIFLTFGDETKRAPVFPSPKDTLTTPLGSPDNSKISLMIAATGKAASEVLTTTVLPAKSAKTISPMGIEKG